MRTHHRIRQNTDEWHDIRRGLFTSSNVYALFSDPKTKRDKELGKLSKTAQTLVNEKAREVLEFDSTTFSTKATEWGHYYEEYAANAYKEIFDVEIFEGDFWTLGENTGSSPDRLVFEKGLLEIKCHENQNEHIFNLQNIKNQKDLKIHRKEYYYQTQHQLYVTGREWCDFLSFDPRFFCNELTVKAGFVCFRIFPEDSVFKDFETRIQIASEMRDKVVNDILEYDINYL